MYPQNEINEVLSKMVDAGIISMTINDDNEFTFFMTEDQKLECDRRRLMGEDLTGKGFDGYTLPEARDGDDI